MSDRPDVRPVPPPTHASARKRADASHGTNDGTNAERRLSKAEAKRDAARAYHLERVTRKFKMVISAENAELLAELLGDDYNAEKRDSA